jgi:adenosine/AMP kinase
VETIEVDRVRIEKDEETNLILGMSHFIKTVEDLYEAMVNSVPNAKFGIAFCEASAKCLVRWTGNDEGLTELAKKNAQAIGAGHSFIIMMKDCYPINVLRAIKMVPEVCSIHCATANPVEVIIAENEAGRGILGVIDGNKPKGVEGPEDQEWRHDFLRKIGYKQ